MGNMLDVHTILHHVNALNGELLAENERLVAENERLFKDAQQPHTNSWYANLWGFVNNWLVAMGEPVFSHESHDNIKMTRHRSYEERLESVASGRRRDRGGATVTSILHGDLQRIIEHCEAIAFILRKSGIEEAAGIDIFDSAVSRPYEWPEVVE